MIAQLLNRDFVLALARNAQDELAAEALARSSDPAARRRTSRRRDAVDELSDEELGDLSARLEAVEVEPETTRTVTPKGRRSAKAETVSKDSSVFIPRDPMLSLVQSAFDEGLEKLYPRALKDRRIPDGRRGGQLPVVTDRQLTAVPFTEQTGGRRILKKFQVTRPKFLSDPRWAVCLIVEAWRELTGPAAFVARPPVVPIADDARLVLLGDWGSGLPRARRVADRAREALAADERSERHVIHLGDVYYSGLPNEYRRRFLKYWPVAVGADVGSFSLSGNHDMYSGGHGYYDVCLADDRFRRQDGCSFFALRNDHWLIICLDSSYEDAGLHGRQAEWARELIESSDPDLGVVLMSHHQLFSAHEPGAECLGKKIQPVLATGRVDGWFWGHEHRCIQYGESHHDGARLGFASCVGHAGIPEYLVMSEGQSCPAPWQYEYLKQYGSGLEPWDTFGLAILELGTDSIRVRYVDEHGVEHHKAELKRGGRP